MSSVSASRSSITGGAGSRPSSASASTASPGEIFGLLGPNGAGKTTTLRILSTVLRPTGGRAVVAGHDVAREPEAVRASIGYMSASTGIYDRMTAWELVDTSAGSTGCREDRLRERMESIFGWLQMDDFRDVLGSKMSTGMKQKVSIARTIVHDPPVLIFDEPTSGLDVLVARVVLQKIVELRDLGKTILFSTHSMREVEKLCSRVAIIYKGRVQAEGSRSSCWNGSGSPTSKSCSSTWSSGRTPAIGLEPASIEPVAEVSTDTWNVRWRTSGRSSAARSATSSATAGRCSWSSSCRSCSTRSWGSAIFSLPRPSSRRPGPSSSSATSICRPPPAPERLQETASSPRSSIPRRSSRTCSRSELKTTDRDSSRPEGRPQGHPRRPGRRGGRDPARRQPSRSSPLFRPSCRSVSDSTEEPSQFTYLRVREVLDPGRMAIVQARLARDQKPPAYTEPIEINGRGRRPRQRGRQQRLGPDLPVPAGDHGPTGAFYPAVDLCAGEKERGTMEPLLISPASRSEIVLGKFFTVMLASMATALRNLMSMGVTGIAASPTR